MKMNKKMIATTLGALFVFSAMGSAYAAVDVSTSTPNQGIVKPYADKKEAGNKGGFHGAGGQTLEKRAAEKGVTVDELKAQLEQERQAKLEKLAAEKGITVDELNAQMEQERGSKGGPTGGPREGNKAGNKGGMPGGPGGQTLEQRAAEKGITVDELKTQMEQEQQARLEKIATEKGITVDELKAQIKLERGSKGGLMGGPGGFGGPGRQTLEQRAAEKGITVDELKAQMEQEHANHAHVDVK